MTEPKPLRAQLAGAIESRRAAMRGQRGRMDSGDVLVSIGFVNEFLASYPHADDYRVREWCRSNPGHVRRVVPQNQKAVMDALFA